MTNVTFQGVAYPVQEGQSVLEALLQSGAEVPHACRKGTCFTCLMTCREGEVGGQAQKGLRPAQVGRGDFLACQHRPSGSIAVALPDQAGPAAAAEVVGKERLGADVCGLRLRPDQPLDYRAGQFVTLRRADGVARSYSLASVPALDGALEFHVKRLPGGLFSNWVFDDLRVGDALALEGPYGECFYECQASQQPLLLVGTGTGLAPLIAVARDALQQGHSGALHLYHGSRRRSGLYHREALAALAEAHRNFVYHPCVSGEDAGDGLRHQRADLAAFADFSDLSGWRVYLCGYPAMVEGAKKTAFLQGASLQEIHADPFELRDLRQAARPDAPPAPPDTW